MSLNEDVLSQIFEVLREDKNSLYSCLFVNKIWCVTAVPILWRNPNSYYNFNPFSLLYYTIDSDKSKKILFNIILLNLSEESRDILKNQGIDINNFITEKYKRPLFNYINYWKYLNLLFIEKLITYSGIETSKVSIIRNEILKLFINTNTNFIHLTVLKYVSCSLMDLKYRLNYISEFKCCFSNLESIHCNNYISDNILEELAKICKSIKKLRFDIICQTITYGIIKLIEAQNNLNDINFSNFVVFNHSHNQLIRYFEKSLIKHADTIQYLKINSIPDMGLRRFLSYFVNLLSLEIMFSVFYNDFYGENLSLPNLKILKVRLVSPNIVTSIIENTKGNLSEISLVYDGYNEKIIQAIYENCPNLQYLKLSYNLAGLLISGLENLLTSCQFLNELVIETHNNYNMDELFILLTKFSPITLFKFEFITYEINLDNIKLFLDNWKDRNPMLLKLNVRGKEIKQQLEDLAEEYKNKKEYTRDLNESMALKCLNNSQNISSNFLNEVKTYSIDNYNNFDNFLMGF
ncbi:hypothetical protein GLOIN_2v1878576 [Rhizophagus irregularis DAOM 181602=DAOM 197198]|uniref:F-box domain-containing protein n=1 Tax=Rhizophagus irregularis (strain DAOM 181602 / DAOM 197198 / MUCL 43194) TaxID=747089 RepID=U9T6U0_RHIID|nr:hypothetical protein GLOIN_2v1878576 [Rhizophagus irregularis DAOM 181602=DAOM 197198]POG68121.1 hypothetical protein GLOIN_2v1878576 [Rhizophagus irregularis DAOM 181602=DAOM 197198]|eukprot:XP_025174987.1 hypothetical protein GLOIN_2v1878576 [Rhizophagus irregularis DAOM 181602=DAOM 197198]